MRKKIDVKEKRHERKKDAKEKKTQKKKRRIKTYHHHNQLRNYEAAMPYVGLKM